MATVKQYALSLWRAQIEVARKQGVDLRRVSLELRVLLLCTDVVFAGILRILFLKGVATDAEMQTLFTNIRDADYPQLPERAPVLDEAGDTPEPDLGTDGGV